MNRKIFEEKPVAAEKQSMGGEKAIIEKKARQLAYDTRYQVKKEVGDKKVNPIVVKQLLIKQLQKSTAAPAIKARAKQMLLGEDYIGDTRDMASNSLANALLKVFVEGVKKESESIHLDYLQELAENPDKKYKVRVTDKKTGKSYVRYATREKITQLRANPNIQSVEMTEYGDPREGERKKGESTARAKSGRGLDPVGREDADVDNDGKKNDSNDKYIMKRRKAIGNAIQQRQNVSASYEPEGEIVETHKKGDKKKPKRWWDDDGDGIGWEKGEVKKEEYVADSANFSSKKITGKGVDNYAGGKDSVVKIFPDDGQDKVDRAGQTSSPASMGIMAGYEMGNGIIIETEITSSQQKFLEMLQEKKMGKKEKAKEKKLKRKYDKSGMKASMKKQYGERGEDVYFATIRKQAMKEECDCEDKAKKEDTIGDVRELPAKISLAKNKLRSIGIKC